MSYNAFILAENEYRTSTKVYNLTKSLFNKKNLKIKKDRGRISPTYIGRGFR